MIVQFKIQNFRSILDMTLDFRYTEGKAPNGHKEWDTLPFLEDAAKNRIIPCLAIFGANAAGKSNILRAMDAFCHAMTRNATEYFDPNMLHDGHEVTRFQLTVLHNTDTYVYDFAYNATEIRSESLTKNGIQLYSIEQLNASFAFAVDAVIGYADDRLQSILTVECSDGQGHQTTTFLRRVAQNYPGLNRDLKIMFDAIHDGIIVLPDNEISLPGILDMLKPFYAENRDAALEEIVSIVRMLDIDIQSLAISSRLVTPSEMKRPDLNDVFYRKLPDGKQFEVSDVRSYHRNMHGKSVEFKFMRQESQGTIRITSLVGLMLFSLKSGTTLFIDELENSLHPLLLKELLRMFKSKRYNQSCAQIVFSTHCTDILDNAILRLGEVAIVRKTPSTGTLVRRLIDFKENGLDVRNVTNFRKQYLDGFYSGIPHPAL